MIYRLSPAASLGMGLTLGFLVLLLPVRLPAQNFLRGDVDCDGCVGPIDAHILNTILFRQARPPCNCEAARDIDCNDVVDVADVIFLLNFLYLGGFPPCAPFPASGPPPAGGVLGCAGYPQEPLFKRGDVNQDGCVSAADVTFLQDFLFQNGTPPACLQSADANDDDTVDQADVVYLLAYCEGGGSAPPAPGPYRCGTDPTPGLLDCQSYSPQACCGSCTNQVPCDCDQDGQLTIGDPVCLLSALFLGTVRLPCGDGLAIHPSNLDLMSCDGDSRLDVTDAVHLLGYLFLGGPPPARGLRCIPILGCPQNTGCPDCIP